MVDTHRADAAAIAEIEAGIARLIQAQRIVTQTIFEFQADAEVTRDTHCGASWHRAALRSDLLNRMCGASLDLAHLLDVARGILTVGAGS